MLLDLDRRPAGFDADNATASNELQSAIIVQLLGPTDAKLDPAAGHKIMVGGEEDPAARDVNGPAPSGLLNALPVEGLETDSAFDGKALCRTAF